ncbi:MAG: hypothetical protein CR984_00415 [Proteobacteria bacterium]|nr:MAG: hypothetical protein CR984_00415 [Pseudomonadota bacterium]
MGFRGIKNRVLVVFWVLFFLSMGFMDVMIVSLFLQDSLNRIIKQKRLSLALIGQACTKMHPDEHRNLADVLSHYLPDGDRIIILTPNQPQPHAMVAESPVNNLERLVLETMKTGDITTQHFGRSFGIFFRQYRSVIVTQPVKQQGKIVAAAGIETDLTDIYRVYRRIQKIAFTFIFVISLFFALIANRQLTRIYFRPLKRLALRAESYQDDSPLFFSVRKEDNEFSILSTSLNKMLNRIAEDKSKLQETIQSLKSANHQLKQAQEDVIRAEKLASVGRMTSGIAHEIGNPIGIVLGYLDLLKQKNLKSNEREDFIKRSEAEITRINDIIRQLLDMSRYSDGETTSTAIHDLCNDLIAVFNHQPHANQIKFRTDFFATKDAVRADPDRLRQVLLNIILNAIDALVESDVTKPCITIGSENGVVQSMEGGPITSIVLRISDNGPGINAADIPHLFDPFFTTKPPGQGTGLGLSVAIMIVEKMGGRISVDSHERHGTTFSITLPLGIQNA